MKLLQAVGCISLMLALCSCHPLKPLNASGPLPLAHTCLRITSNGEMDNRAPVFILHGFTGFKEMYLGISQVIALKTSRRVCLVDLRNHGDSPWSNETDSKVMAEDVKLLMSTLGMEKIVVLGHSMGGKVAVEFALANPQKVEKVIVEDMRPNGLSEDAMKFFGVSLVGFRDALNDIPKGSTEKEAKQVIAKFFKSMLGSLNDPVTIDERIVNYIPIRCSEDGCSWKANMDILDKINLEPLKYWTTSSGLCDKPALFIYGKISPFKVADVKEEIIELFPNAELFPIKGGSHMLDGYPEYREKVISFINA